ncbi:uncharacterized protein LOC126832344 [Patella vulgata]|uniref:uncharacterized protein LOC126832344 n=1 Tax=Patella vulgata TaxID=6465 RepID=UPI00217F9016|nr:uncharacterized protein LOC126832344 [Patella vulgata]XP_055959481.1 uncharacterized protein LOC126832344 [Patella vulgata]
MITLILNLTLRLFLFSAVLLVSGLGLSMGLDLNLYSILIKITTQFYEYEVPPIVYFILKSGLQIVIILFEICRNFSLTILSFCAKVFVTTFEVLFMISPQIFRCLLMIASFLTEVFTQLILGCGNSLNYVLSWIISLSLVFLYLDSKYNTNRNRQVQFVNNENTNLNDITNNSDIPINTEHTTSETSRLQYYKDLNWLKREFKRQQEIRNNLNPLLNQELVHLLSLIAQPNLDSRPNQNPSEPQETNNIDRNSESSSDDTDAEADFSGHEENSNLCTICMEENRCVATFPCGHTHLCFSCVRQIMASTKNCPICIEKIQEFKQIYL